MQLWLDSVCMIVLLTFLSWPSYALYCVRYSTAAVCQLFNKPMIDWLNYNTSISSSINDERVAAAGGRTSVAPSEQGILCVCRVVRENDVVRNIGSFTIRYVVLWTASFCRITRQTQRSLFQRMHTSVKPAPGQTLLVLPCCYIEDTMFNKIIFVVTVLVVVTFFNHNFVNCKAVPQSYLPDRSEVLYNLRKRHQNKTLIHRTVDLNDRDFLARNLYYAVVLYLANYAYVTVRSLNFVLVTFWIYFLLLH